MKYALLAALVWFTFTTTAQTTNIIVRTKDSLFVGADSRVVDGNTNKFDTICKIVKSGHTYFTFAGYMFEDGINHLTQYFDSTQSISVIAEQYLRNRYKALLSKLQTLYYKSPSFYREHYKEHIWAEAIFFGIENDSISCKLTVLELKSPVNAPPQIDSSITDLVYQPIAPFLARAGGHTEAVAPLIYNRGIWAKGYQAGIDSLMRLQSRATPDNVAFPIAIILITPKKQKWLCPCIVRNTRAKQH